MRNLEYNSSSQNTFRNIKAISGGQLDMAITLSPQEQRQVGAATRQDGSNRDARPLGHVFLLRERERKRERVGETMNGKSKKVNTFFQFCLALFVTIAAVVEARNIHTSRSNAFVRAPVLPRTWGARGSLVLKRAQKEGWAGHQLYNCYTTTNGQSTKYFSNTACTVRASS